MKKKKKTSLLLQASSKL